MKEKILSNDCNSFIYFELFDIVLYQKDEF